MDRIVAGMALAVLLIFPAGLVIGAHVPLPRVGTLNCKILPHSGINLLIHSTREIRCRFTPEAKGLSEYYRGETGIGFGFDVAFGRSSTLDYAVSARQFKTGTHQLAGKYEGTGGNATLGVSVGDTTPIQKRDGSIMLQPIGGKNKGVGAAAGYSYLYLQVDDKPPEQAAPGN
ncbi:MAG: DUF992 domain-containing protein [Mariprofundaceae bacterium]|nr:DUF992 domain-containing protein [Mariprofundaceae bacterium]